MSLSRPVFNPSGAFGYVALPAPFPPATLPSQLFGGAINSLTGELSQIPGTPYDIGWASSVMVFDETGKIFFVTTNAMPGGVGGQIRTFLVNAPSGVLTPIQSFPTGGDGAVVAFLTPGDDFLLVTSFGTSSLTVFAVDKAAGVPTGTLTNVTSPPVLTGPGGPRPTQIVYNRRNNVVYVLNMPSLAGGFAPASVAVFHLDMTTGIPTAVSAPVSTNGGAGAMFLHPSGRFLFQYNTTTASFQRFTLDPTTGAATLQPDVTAVGPIGGFLIDSSGRYLYASNSGAGTVSSYAINPTTGALTLINAAPAGAAPGFPTPFMFQ